MSITEPSPTATARAAPRDWAALAVLALPTLPLGLDVTVLHLALPSLAAELRPSATEALWIVDIYGFLIAGCLITMGTLGDRIGRRRLLLIGAAAFGVASVAAAFSTTPAMLIAARAALGVAGATLMPSTLGLIAHIFADPRQRAVAIGIWATTFASGMALGPLLGGAVLAHLWWGAAFLVAVPCVVALLICGPFALPEYRDRHAARMDVASVALSLAAMLPIVYGVKHAAADGVDATTASALAAGGVGAAAFVRRQLRLGAPLLDVRLFADRALAAALLVLLVGLVGVGGVMLLIAQYLQLVEGRPPTAAGLLMAPPALAMFMAATAAPLIARRVRPGMVIAGTLALSAVGYGLLARLEPGDTATAVAGFALVYLGLGAIAALGTDLVVGAAPPSKGGAAAALSETVQELGIAVGVALLGSLATAVYRHGMSGVTEAARARDSLSAALALGDRAPAVADRAAAAFTTGLNVAASVCAVAIAALAAYAAHALRAVPPLGR